MFTTVYLIAYFGVGLGAGNLLYQSNNQFPDKASCEVIAAQLTTRDPRGGTRFCIPHVISGNGAVIIQK